MEIIRYVFRSFILIIMVVIFLALYLIVTPDQCTAECDACRVELNSIK